MEKNTFDDLLKRANEIRINAYSPYSNFKVGCAILLNDGQIVEGVNVENASYPVGICAERNALSHVVTLGKQGSIKAIALFTDSETLTSPCGMCRQFLSEFLSREVPIILGNARAKKLTTIEELLPMSFNKSSLK